jgi:inorganic triphosphatase YgiF
MGEVRREVELKLRISPEDLPRLRRHPRVRELAVGRARTRVLRSVYFDTRDLALAHRGIGLRLRWADGQAHPTQTLKTRAGGAAGLFERAEAECRVAGDRPDLDAVPDTALARRVRRALSGARLAPVFETRMRRTSRTLRDGRHAWALDLDEGEVRTASAREPFWEVELELCRGGAARLYAFALELAQTIPLLPDGRSKADRGYALLPNAPAPRARPRRAALQPDHSVGQALDRLLHECAQEFTRDAGAALRARDFEEMRPLCEGARRVSSALAFFADALPARRSQRIHRACARLAEGLDAVHEVDQFAALCAESRPPRGLRALQTARLDAARALVRGPHCGRALLELGALLAAAGGPGAARASALRSRAIPSYAAAQLGMRHRSVRAGLEAFAHAPGARARALRGALVKLRHAAEFARPLLRASDARDYRNRLLRLERSFEQLEAGESVDALVWEVLARTPTGSAAALERTAERLRARATRAERRLARSPSLPAQPPPLAVR